MTGSETITQKYDRILSLCDTGKKSGVYTQIRCPASVNHKHNDKTLSASLGLHANGISFKCFAGCQTDDFLKALNLTYKDLFPDSERTPTNIYTYHNADGSYHHDKVKYRDPDGKKTFRQRTIDERGEVRWTAEGGIPFGLPRLVQAVKEDKVILYCEGEKDALTGRVLGYEATTMGGASDWKPDFAKFFKGANLVLIPDKDKAGLSLTSKMQDDLAAVVKSLRVVILPHGKDLTEWVELGNSDLAGLIDAVPDQAKADGLPDPIITRTHDGYSFAWPSNGVIVRISRLTEDCEGTITITDNGKGIHVSKINLLAPRSLTELANKLTKAKKLNWDAVLSRIAIYCAEQQNTVGVLESINLEPATMQLEYQLDPLLPLNQPTTIYAAGGKGKSTFADYLAVLVQFGLCANGNLPFTPVQANVLYLDWESDKETHRRYITAIKRGLDCEMETSDILYLEMEHPIVHVADTIRGIVHSYNIGLIIIDSQMGATATGSRGMNESQIASEYYNTLRSFGCTTLTIDHVTKQAMSGESDSGTAYGSIVKYNRARSQWELKLPDEDDDADHKEYALVHKKVNAGRRHKPIGVACDFDNDGDTLKRITFANAEIKNNPALSQKTLTLKQRIINVLGRMGRANPADLAREMGEPDREDSIKTTLARGAIGNNPWTVHLDKGCYGLRQNGSVT